ncbi:YkuS family protein [Bacillus salitolerans]|uniref:UPF0180 protein ACFSCX_03535 n=1 Tax=Bacillus salitolerans TaxID=1437434 RepID=A0ABW4LNL1_9BACI
MARIGVEGSLTDVRDALKERGYDIVDLRGENDAKNCDCCVVTGLDSNVMGISNTVTAGSVIEANGLTAEEICQQVESRLQR